MTQYVINIGAIPNDGTGDPLRTAFNETNLNFDQVFAAGPVLSNIQIANNKILTTNTNGNLVLAPNGIGIVQSNVSILPNLANLRDLGSSTQRWRTVYAQYLDVSANLNITGNIIYNGDLTVAGNLTVQGNIIQVGNIVTETLTIQLANAASTANAANGSGITVGANDNIATLLYNSTGNVWTTNIGLSSVGNITAPYLFGNGSQLTGLAATYGNANVVTLLSGFGSNTVSTTGNITGGYLFGNGSQLTGLGATYSNANVVTLLASFGSNTVSTSGNITGGFILGNGSQLTGLPATYGNANVATFMAAFGSNTISSTGNITTTANVSGGFILGNVAFANGLSTYGNSNVTTLLSAFGSNPISTTGNVTSGNISVAGNVTGAYIKGNGSGLTSLPAPTVTQDITSNGAMSIMTYDGVIKYVNYATVEPSSGNIAGGNITTTGLVSATGNITAGNVNSPTLNNSGNIRVVASGNTWTFDTTGNLTVPGNILGSGNILIAPDSASASSYLDIYLTGGPDIHIASNDNSIVIGRDTGANIFVGNDGDVSIRTDNGATPQVWDFDNTGTTQFPGNILVAPAGNPLVIKTTSGNAYSTLNTGASGGYTSIGIQDNTTGAYQAWAYVKTEMANVNTPSAKVVVVPGNTGAEVTWTFDASGNTTFPNGAIFTGYDLYAAANSYVELAGDTGNTYMGVGNTSAFIQTDWNGAQYQWNFLANGVMTAPGAVSAVGNVTGGNLITAGSGGAITMTGGNITGVGNISAGNISATGNVTANYFIGNLATPTYGSFYDTTTQINSNVGNAIAISYNTTDINNGVTIAGAGNTQITIAKTGIYNIQFSLQVLKTDAGSDTVYVWLDKNGNRVANTGTGLYLVGDNAAEVAAWNFVVSATAGDYYRLMWMSTDSHVELLATAAGAVVPAIPSVILTVVPVGA